MPLIATTAMMFVLVAAPASSGKQDAREREHRKPAPERAEQKPAPEQKPAEYSHQKGAPDKEPSHGRRSTAHTSDDAPSREDHAAPSRSKHRGNNRAGGGASRPDGASTRPAATASAAEAPPAPAAPAAPAALSADRSPPALVAARQKTSSTPTDGRRRPGARRASSRTATARVAPQRPSPSRAPSSRPPSRVGSRSPSTTARPAARDRPGEGSPLPQALTRIIQVVPESLLALLGLLGALTLGFGAVSAVAGRRAHRLEQERRRLTADVGLLQSALLPELPERVGAATVSAAYRPAAGGSSAGGGFYDAFALPDGRTGIVVGEIRDGGREALALGTLVRYTLRTQLENGLQPRLALQAADTVLLRQLRGQLAQAAAGVFDPATGYLTYACAGHPQPVITGGDHRPVDALESPPLGSGLRTGGRQTAVPLGPGRSAVFGSLESDEGMLKSNSAGAGAAAIVRALGSSNRDATVLVLRPEGHCANPPFASYEELEVRGADWPGAGVFLDACQLELEDASLVLQEARDTIVRTGTALLEVRRDGNGARASVEAGAPPHRQAHQRPLQASPHTEAAGRWTSADDRVVRAHPVTR